MRAVEAEQGSLGCKRKLDGWALKQGNSFVSAHRGSFFLIQLSWVVSLPISA